MAAVWQSQMIRFRENSRHCYRFLYVFGKIFVVRIRRIHRCKIKTLKINKLDIHITAQKW